MAEQRYKAVQAVLADGRTVNEVAGDWGISRRTMHRWLAHFEAGRCEQSLRPSRPPWKPWCSRCIEAGCRISRHPLVARGGRVQNSDGSRSIHLEDNRADLSRWRAVDHVAVWSQAAAVGLAAWTAVEHEHFDIGSLPLLALLLLASLVGLGGGIGSLATRRQGDIWWPALIGIVPAVGLLLTGGALMLAVLSSPCGFTYC